MKSRVTIDLDEDNSPIVKVEFLDSEDVRDKLVKRFIDSFGDISSWAKVRFGDYKPNGNGMTLLVKPIRGCYLPGEIPLIQERAAIFGDINVPDALSK